jgi:hypothetical protein
MEYLRAHAFTFRLGSWEGTVISVSRCHNQYRIVRRAASAAAGAALVLGVRVLCRVELKKRIKWRMAAS